MAKACRAGIHVAKRPNNAIARTTPQSTADRVVLLHRQSVQENGWQTLQRQAQQRPGE